MKKFLSILLCCLVGFFGVCAASCDDITDLNPGGNPSITEPEDPNETTETPDAPDTPETPETPENPEETPETPGDSGESGEIPETPETPEDQDDSEEQGGSDDQDPQDPTDPGDNNPDLPPEPVDPDQDKDNPSTPDQDQDEDPSQSVSPELQATAEEIIAFFDGNNFALLSQSASDGVVTLTIQINHDEDLDYVMEMSEAIFECFPDFLITSEIVDDTIVITITQK